FQDGYTTALVERVRQMRGDITSKIYNTPAAREEIENALGAQRARELEAHLHVESIMNMGNTAIRGNSSTARQLAHLGIAGGVGGLTAYATGSGALDPTSLLAAALTYGAARGRNTINTN